MSKSRKSRSVRDLSAVRAPAAPLVEPLEDRRHLSVTLTGGVLSVDGTPGGDDVRFEARAGGTSLRVRVNGRDQSFPMAAVNSIKVRGLAGNDRISFEDDAAGRVAKPTSIDAGDGHDRVDGSAGPDTILGGNGNDRLDGQFGNDSVDGGVGNDQVEGGAGNDTLLGGAGNDVLDGDSGNDLVQGGDGADRIKGGPGVDSLFGNAGNDDFSDDDARSEIKDLLAEDRGSNGVGSGGSGRSGRDDDDRSGSNSGRR
jgi:Ca2+-binding RTX toxin-like protein